ncbi:glucuronate isomerase [Pullulanibacillus camelliae]|uniref:Glucuronate isomerase n=1 Tax=Pullulanibacillus camelliae TaxID=1707096 RepID=A0A8J3DWB5_9BACL|nr:glucuronate isomerase [Pullulanibacillus camelliae]GGE49237.1 glucuronate isomerase [Pullulanibacillus camelliae]
MSVQSKELLTVVEEIVNHTTITDVHTHLFAPEFGDQLLYGIDELLTYHYLIAETMRVSDIDYDTYWKMSRQEQAETIWEALFIHHTPYSEACRGVITVLQKLGMDVSTRDLESYREALGRYPLEEYIALIFEKANVSSVVMTNDPFDEQERKVWLSQTTRDERFHAALRIDPLINDYDTVYKDLQAWGYQVDADLTESTIQELRRFVSEWIERMQALYVAVSLPDTFVYPEHSVRSTLIEKVILPVCREHQLPFALMIGVKRLVNESLRSAGDSVGKADIQAVEALCKSFPTNKFMVTMLSRENQHELAVTARKFRNLMVFGCWWFLNNPTLIEEMTAMRFELLGTSVIPQHSDARILDQLVYKWSHSREVIAKVLTEQYERLIEAGWNLTEEEIRRDVGQLFNDNFWDFINLKLS